MLVICAWMFLYSLHTWVIIGCILYVVFGENMLRKSVVKNLNLLYGVLLCKYVLHHYICFIAMNMLLLICWSVAAIETVFLLLITNAKNLFWTTVLNLDFAESILLILAVKYLFVLWETSVHMRWVFIDYLWEIHSCKLCYILDFVGDLYLIFRPSSFW